MGPGVLTGNAVLVAPDGDIYVAGAITEGVESSEGIRAFLMKLDDKGNEIQTAVWGSNDDDSAAQAITIDSKESVYVVGTTDSETLFDEQKCLGSYDVYLTKFDHTGQKLWSKILGSDKLDGAVSVACDGRDNIYVAGVTTGSFAGQTNAGNDWKKDPFLIKFAANGEELWTRIWGSVDNDVTTALAVTSEGTAYVAGRTTGTFDGQIHAGPYNNVFLTKIDGDGTKQWSRIYGSALNDTATSLVTDDDGNVYVTGWVGGPLEGQAYDGSVDAFLAKYSPAGEQEWIDTWGSSETDEAEFVGLDDKENVFVAGTTWGSFDKQGNMGSLDCFICVFNSIGERQTGRLWGTSSTDSVNAGAITAIGDIVLVGVTSTMNNNWVIQKDTYSTVASKLSYTGATALFKDQEK